MPIQNQQVRSPALSEFAKIQPSWIVRRGISLFFFVIVALIGCTWFIYYPETLTCNAKINAVNGPVEVKSNGGRIVKFLKAEKDTIVQGELLAIMESTANVEQVQGVEQLITHLNSLIEQEDYNATLQTWNSAKNDFTQLGDLQSAHQNFIQSFLTFKNYFASDFMIQKKAMLQKELSNAKKIYENLKQQQRLQREDIDLAAEQYNMNQQLYRVSIINSFEIRNQKSQWLNKQLTVPQMEANLINTGAQQNGNFKEMLEIDKQAYEQKNSFVQAVYTYYNAIKNWEQKYFIISPVSGIIKFDDYVNANEILEQGKRICFIEQQSNTINGEIVIPNAEIVKVKKGMDINLKLAAYPYEEFGVVKAKVGDIKEIPTDSGFVAKVVFPNDFKTQRNKQLSFRYGMTAQGDIMLNNNRLLYKIINGLVKR